MDEIELGQYGSQLGAGFVNSAVTGSLYLIAAVGLTLTYGLSGFPNFAYAEFMTLGAFIGFIVAHQLGFDFSFAFVVAFLVSGILGALTYQGVFRFLANRGSTKIHLMVASIGLGFIIRHIIGDIWGWPPRTLGITWSAFDIGPTYVQVFCPCATIYKFAPAETLKKAKETEITEYMTPAAKEFIEKVEKSYESRETGGEE